VYLSVFSLALTGCMHFAEPGHWIVRTDRYFFACDEDGNIIWKTAIEEGGGGGHYGPVISYLIFPQAVRWYDGKTGELIQELKFEKRITSTIGKDNHLKIRLEGDTVFTVIDRWKGKILGNEPFRQPERPKFITEDPVRPLIDSLMRPHGKMQLEDLGIEVMSTSKWILAFDQEANVLWKVAIPENWGRSSESRIHYGGRCPLGFYSGEDNTVCAYAYFEENIMGLDRLTGKILYKKTLPAAIDYSSFSGSGIVFLKLKDGHWYQLTPKDGEVVLIK